MTKRPVAYNCEQLGSDLVCDDFYPSDRVREQTREQYLERQKRCEELADDEAAFRRAGCKRKAHLMVPQGRSERRYGATESPKASRTGLSYRERLESLQTPLTARTQAELSRIGQREPNVYEMMRDVRLADRKARGEQLTQVLLSKEKDGYVSITPTLLDTPVFQDLADWDSLQKAREAAAAAKDGRFSLQIPVEGVGPLAENLVKAKKLFLNRVAKAIWGVQKGWQKLTLTRDRGVLHLAINRDAKLEWPDAPNDSILVIEGVDGDKDFRRELDKAYGRVSTYDNEEARALLSLAFFLRLFVELGKSGKPTAALTVRTRGVGRQFITLPPIKVKGLQHSVLMAPDAPRKGRRYGPYAGFSPADFALSLLGTDKKSDVIRRKRRGRNLSPLLARENPMRRPTLVDFNRFLDLRPGEFRPVGGGSKDCVYRKVSDADTPLEEQFTITTCKRARSWQTLYSRNLQVVQIAKREAAQAAQENPMKRPRRNPDPLTQLLEEFGHPPAARPNGHMRKFDPNHRSSAAYGPGPFVPTNRRNPAAGEAMRMAHEKGISLKDAWRRVKRNPAYSDESGTPWQDNSQYEWQQGPFTAGAQEPPVNRRNPSYRAMKGAELQALANRGDGAARREMERRSKKRR